MPVNCLFYVDDLVTDLRIRRSPHRHIFTTSIYNSINHKKTKGVTFSKYKKGRDNTMLFGETTIYSDDSYCYLGSVFTNNGYLKSTGHSLHDKAMKAMYTILRKDFKYSTCDIRSMVSLFDKMILPIATYNSEIWGNMCFPVNKMNNNFIHFGNRKNPIEDVQIKLCKRLLGVSDKATNWAVVSEVGRFPTTIFIITTMVVLVPPNSV